MPLAGWLHPIASERVPLDYFDYDTSCDGRAAYSPALARFSALKEQHDERHHTLNVTTTRCMGYPRQTFISTLFPYYLDPRKRAGDNHNSRAIIDATRPFEWRDEFPPVAESSPELAAETLKKWGHLID